MLAADIQLRFSRLDGDNNDIRDGCSKYACALTRRQQRGQRGPPQMQMAAGTSA